MCIRDRSDTSPIPSVHSGVQVHRGFFDAWRSVWVDAESGSIGMQTHLTQLLHRTKKPVLCVGHSLGGALATIACCALVAQAKVTGSEIQYLLSTRPNPKQQSLKDSRLSLWTLGCPRVGNSEMGAYLNAHVKDIWRIFTFSDPVIRLPDSYLPCDTYSHVGTRVMLLEEGDIVIEPSGHLSSVSPFTCTCWQFGLSVHRHRMKFYRGCILSWIDNFSTGPNKANLASLLIPLEPPEEAEIERHLEKAFSTAMSRRETERLSVDWTSGSSVASETLNAGTVQVVVSECIGSEDARGEFTRSEDHSRSKAVVIGGPLSKPRSTIGRIG
eukprot:TRINITY_DN16748_c0_g1_i3.p1 TRINITY_DN16748_c0_g1~~TRINITY_DN16748_c0_g1_i3.p1  ORF type:complete len:327 (+),score=53.83 TRINITY_DN16748_c0_g1_i3:118-1098(+)